MSVGNNDLRGLDILVSPVIKSEHPPQAAPPQAASVSSTERTYNLSEVAIRWGCTATQVKKEISLGMPMVKKSNGRWEIKERELAYWEEILVERREQEDVKRRRKNIVIITASIVTLIICFAFFYIYILPNLSI